MAHRLCSYAREQPGMHALPPPPFTALNPNSPSFHLPWTHLSCINSHFTVFYYQLIMVSVHCVHLTRSMQSQLVCICVSFAVCVDNITYVRTHNVIVNGKWLSNATDRYGQVFFVFFIQFVQRSRVQFVILFFVDSHLHFCVFVKTCHEMWHLTTVNYIKLHTLFLIHCLP